MLNKDVGELTNDVGELTSRPSDLLPFTMFAYLFAFCLFACLLSRRVTITHLISTMASCLSV